MKGHRTCHGGSYVTTDSCTMSHDRNSQCDRHKCRVSQQNGTLMMVCSRDMGDCTEVTAAQSGCSFTQHVYAAHENNNNCQLMCQSG